MDQDPTKQMLIEIRDAVCGVAGEVNPNVAVSDGLRALIAEKITKAAVLGEKLLTDSNGPLYAPAPTWVFWSPITLAQNPTLHWMTDTACKEAQRVLDEYCGNDPLPPNGAQAEQASMGLWRLSQLYPHILNKAGITSPTAVDSPLGHG